MSAELTKCMYGNTMESSFLPASFHSGRALERLPFFVELQRSQQQVCAVRRVCLYLYDREAQRDRQDPLCARLDGSAGAQARSERTVGTSTNALALMRV